MTILLIAIAVLIGTGVATLAVNGNARLTTIFGAGGILLGSLIGLWPSVVRLLDGNVQSSEFPWRIPGGSFHVQIDPQMTSFRSVFRKWVLS